MCRCAGPVQNRSASRRRLFKAWPLGAIDLPCHGITARWHPTISYYTWGGVKYLNGSVSAPPDKSTQSCYRRPMTVQTISRANEKPETQPVETPTALIERLARAGRAAQTELARLSDAQKATALRSAAAALRDAAPAVLAANARDIAAGEANGLTGAMLDRLRLDPARLAAVADAVEQVAALPDPVGQIIDVNTRPNGLVLWRLRVPIGLIGIIYESRPNVTADAAALCLRSGNAVLLRGGSESRASSSAIHACLVAGLRAAGLPDTCIQLVPTADRAA